MALLTSTATLKRLDASLGYLLCKLLGYWRHYAGLAERAPTPPPDSVRRVLFIRPGGLGDMLMLLPVIRALQAARPELHIDIVCERRNTDVLTLAGLAAHAILYDRQPWRLLAPRRPRYDVVIDTEQFHNFSAIMALCSRAPTRVGFRINPARLHLYTHLVSYDIDGYELDQFARLLAPLGLAVPPLRLAGALTGITPTLDAQVPAAIAGLRHRRPLIAISPGSRDPYKQWGPQRFAHLLRELTARGYGCVLIGGPAERAQAEALAQAAPAEALVNAVGTGSLRQTAAILSAARLFIGGDSGLGHLAVALNCPTLILFGPSDPRKWSHADASHQVLRHELPCSPCSIFGYRKLCREIPCMSGISVEAVLKSANAMIAPP